MSEAAKFALIIGSTMGWLGSFLLAVHHLIGAKPNKLIAGVFGAIAVASFILAGVLWHLWFPTLS